MGYTDGLSERTSSREQLIGDPGLETDDDDEDSRRILYVASFDELAENYVKYESIIWFWISLMLVLAWGVGIFMLLYLPYKRFVLQKDISSRKLYVTPTQIVYKVEHCLLGDLFRDGIRELVDECVCLSFVCLFGIGFETFVHTLLGHDNN